jgi:glutathione S-transferase
MTAALSTNRFVTIPFSHYCEKARWAMDLCQFPYHEEGHLPLFHRLGTKRVGGKNSVPVLSTPGQVFSDSSDILKYLNEFSAFKLYPENLNDRARVMQLESDFDNKLGPATRRYFYFHMMPNKNAMMGVLRQNIPPLEATVLPAFFPILKMLILKSLRINEEGAKRSHEKIDAVFAQVEEILRPGQEFLVGNSISAADISFASLAAPILFPENYGVPLPSLKEIPEAMQVEILKWQTSKAGQFALKLYQNFRKSGS